MSFVVGNGQRVNFLKETWCGQRREEARTPCSSNSTMIGSWRMSRDFCLGLE